MTRYEEVGAEAVAKSLQNTLDALKAQGGVCQSCRMEGLNTVRYDDDDDEAAATKVRYHEYVPGGDYSLEEAEAAFMLKHYFPAVLDEQRLRPYEWRIESDTQLKGTLFLGRHLFEHLAKV